MEETVIVLFENNELTVQTSQLISKGALKLIAYDNSEKVIIEKEILNTDFIRTRVNLFPGKYKLQIITPSSIITKNISIDR